MQQIKIQCPAKINLTLKVTGKREDGYHNIDSIMQTINLFDYLTISVEKSATTEIILNGTSDEIPYDKKNLVYKACLLFLEKTNIQAYRIKVFIEKNIPIAAGLAGGSTDAAGMIYGLNILFDEPLSRKELHEICAKLGSDLNLCLEGGRQQTSGRGEILEAMPFEEFDVSLIKPINLGISAKEAYTKFSEKIKIYPSGVDIADKLPTGGLRQGARDTFRNDLEWALIDDYEELRQIKKVYPNAIMSGSGSTYFGINMNFAEQTGFWIKNGLKSISYGVKEV